MKAFGIRPASLTDIDKLVVLAGACEGAGLWNRSVWEETIRSSTAPEATRAVLVLHEGPEILAFGVLLAAGGEGEIENLGVLPSCRRQGFARRTVVALLSWAETVGVRRVHLEVRSSNAAARALYGGLGFEISGKRRGYYRDPDDDAILMSVELDEPVKLRNDASGMRTL